MLEPYICSILNWCAQVFTTMEEAQQRSSLQILDWGVANATLEEVFIKFARSIGAESSA